VRHNPSTVVVLAGQPGAGLLTAVSRPANVTLVRPELPAGADGSTDEGIEPALSALRRAARISSPYVLVAADPLAAVAAQWQAMWELTQAPHGTEAFELRAGEALAAWRANQFELPDYYLVLAQEQQPGGPAGGQEQPPDFYLGPLRALRPHRVAVVVASEPAEQAAGIVSALGSLRHGRWWPPLPDVIDSARRFYPGSLSASPDGAAVPLLRLRGLPLFFPGFLARHPRLGASNVRPPRHHGYAARAVAPARPVTGALAGPQSWGAQLAGALLAGAVLPREYPGHRSPRATGLWGPQVSGAQLSGALLLGTPRSCDCLPGHCLPGTASPIDSWA
jgi:hypothetical protein